MASKFRTVLLATAAAAAPGSAWAQIQPSGAAPAASPLPQQESTGVAAGAQEPGQQATSVNAGAVGDIIVTAQKREQSLNSVGMSVTALSSQTLAERGVQNVADLAKVVPGFVYTPSSFQTPVYTLRGVGVYESGFATSPAVTVYLDEVALPYPIMQVGVGLDLQRVEVLKGPQGTLFGGNSTGGAINYIAAKPSDAAEAGGSLTYARFNEAVLNAFVSGPVTDTLKVRVAAQTDQGGAWQRSVSRGDRNGEQEFYQARLLADWEPTSALTVKLNVNGFYDHGQVPAPQLKFIPPSVLNPALPFANSNYPGYANVPADIFTGPIGPGQQPRVVGKDSRDADWVSDWNDNRRSNSFVQIALRADYKLGSELTLTSISDFAYTHQSNYTPASGTALPLFDLHTFGHVGVFNQEIRLAGEMPRFNWVAGGAYTHTDASETDFFRLGGTLFTLFDFRPLAAVGVPAPFAQLVKASTINDLTSQKVNEYAAFANGEYKLGDRLTVQGGLRYTRNDRRAYSCDSDPSAADQFGRLVETLQLLFRGAVTPVPTGVCVSLNAGFNPGPVRNTLNEDNLSWRGGLTYKVPGGPLFYIIASRGYKAGVVAVIGASSQSQLAPIRQERLDAYEAGIKAPLGRIAQLNLSGFYYDYRNKQVRGTVNDPFFGALERLINVPKSEIAGGEASLEVRPFAGLTLSGAATYLHSEVRGDFVTTTQENLTGNVAGSRLPLTPKWTANADVAYRWNVGDRLRMLAGASVVYHSASNVTFATGSLPAPDYVLNGYTLLDLRAGIGRRDDAWRLTVFGRNVTNAYYVVGAFNSQATRYAYVGLPTTYGATLAVSFR